MVFPAESLLSSYCEDRFAIASFELAPRTAEDQKNSPQLDSSLAFRQKSRGDPPSPPPQPPPSPTGWAMEMPSTGDDDDVDMMSLPGWY